MTVGRQLHLNSVTFRFSIMTYHVARTVGEIYHVFYAVETAIAIKLNLLRLPVHYNFPSIPQTAIQSTQSVPQSSRSPSFEYPPEHINHLHKLGNSPGYPCTLHASTHL